MAAQTWPCTLAARSSDELSRSVHRPSSWRRRGTMSERDQAPLSKRRGSVPQPSRSSPRPSATPPLAAPHSASAPGIASPARRQSKGADLESTTARPPRPQTRSWRRTARSACSSVSFGDEDRAERGGRSAPGSSARRAFAARRSPPPRPAPASP
eukprot:1579848-Rhodomonas_salina.1